MKIEKGLTVMNISEKENGSISVADVDVVLGWVESSASRPHKEWSYVGCHIHPDNLSEYPQFHGDKGKKLYLAGFMKSDQRRALLKAAGDRVNEYRDGNDVSFEVGLKATFTKQVDESFFVMDLNEPLSPTEYAMDGVREKIRASLVRKKERQYETHHEGISICSVVEEVGALSKERPEASKVPLTYPLPISDVKELDREEDGLEL